MEDEAHKIPVAEADAGVSLGLKKSHVKVGLGLLGIGLGGAAYYKYKK